ncbi:MAG: hypothetical protein HFJ30_00325 [Clostridia bacterium]|jgi:hypothetical protein|nr:hypothetical protein [Clostridia bacterium]
MINKEEIEKAKEILYPLSIGDFITWFTTDGVIKVELAVELLLKYIEQLEAREQKLIEKLEQDSSNGFTVEYKDNHKIILKQKIDPVRNYIKRELLPLLKEKSENEQSG